MPAIVAPVVAAVSTAAASFSISGFLLSAASSLVMSAISRALTPKPKKPVIDFGNRSSGLTQMVREPLTTHKIVYGQTRVSGAFVYGAGTQENKYLHLVIVLAAHEVESIDEVWLNDYAIPNDWLNGSGVVTTGRYSGKVRILKYLGGDGQTASPELVAEVPEWTTNHRLRGLAYVYVRLEYDQDIFPSGIPNVSAFIKGKKIFDPRISASGFTTNAALFQYDYLSDDVYGLAAEQEINTTVLNASANIADEYVTVASKQYSVTEVSTSGDQFTIDGDLLELYIGDRVTVASSGSIPSGLSAATNYYVIPYQFKDTPRIRFATSLANALAGTYIDITSAGSGTITVTKNAEPRYHGGGVIDTAVTLEENILDLLSATAGKAIYAGGKWHIKAAAYESPTVTLTADDFVGAVDIDGALSRRERFNSIKGVYRTPLNFDVPSDWPSISSSTYITQDNDEIIWKEYDTPFTQRPQNAKRIAKIELLRARQEITLRCLCNLRAMQIQCGDTVMVTLAQYGWNAKIFEVTNFALVPTDDDTPSYAVQLTLRETAEEIYDWDTSEESEIDFAPNTNLPDPFSVSAVSGVSFSSRPIATLEEDTIYVISLAWNEHSDAFVTGNGQFEIQYKTSYLPPDYVTPNPNWRPSFFVSGALTVTDIFQASPGVLHDVRIRAMNNLGVRSEWVTLLGLSPGSGGGVVASEDWGNYVDTFTSAEDWRSFIESESSAEDWGGYV